MTKNLSIFAALLAFIYYSYVALGLATASNTVYLNSACVQSTADYAQLAAINLPIEAKPAEAKANGSCQAASQNSTVYLKAFGLTP